MDGSMVNIQWLIILSVLFMEVVVVVIIVVAIPLFNSFCNPSPVFDMRPVLTFNSKWKEKNILSFFHFFSF